MIDDPEIRQQAYNYFITESQELLQLIEQELLSLQEDYRWCYQCGVRSH